VLLVKLVLLTPLLLVSPLLVEGVVGAAA